MDVSGLQRPYELFDEPVLVLSPEGGILGGNAAARELMEVRGGAGFPPLHSFVAGDVPLGEHLGRWRESRILCPTGRVTVETVKGRVPFELAGARAASDGGGPEHLVVRFRPVDEGERGRLEQEIQLRLAAETSLKNANVIARRANEELRKVNEELRRSNEDLDDFAYVASHDLRSPLRGIENLAMCVLLDAGKHLPESARRDMEALRGRVQRMDRLLTGLLQYSRVARIREEVEVVDLRKMVGEIAAMIDRPETFTIRCREDVPRFRAEITPLSVVLRNLIANAVKHRDRDDGTVEVAVEERPTAYRFSVRDDGPGIPENQHEAVFRLFKTLKSRDEVEGSGIGLAIVKRAVERQGGRVRIESNPDRGVTFHFTWSKVPGVEA